MEKLQINKGGQPVYLDDLAFLQESSRAALAALVAALTGGAETAIIKEIQATPTDQTAESVTLQVYAGSVCHKGFIYPLERGTIIWPIVDGSVAPMYVHLKETEAEFRTLGSGVDAPTRRKLTAVLRPEGGTGNSFLVDNLPKISPS